MRRLKPGALIAVIAIGVLVGYLVGTRVFRLGASVVYEPSPIAADTLDVPFDLGFEKLSETFELPVFLTHAGDGSGRIFIVEKTGKIQILKDGKRLAQPFLDTRRLITSSGFEQGLLGLAFPPDYETSGRFYVYYTDPSRAINIARFNVSKDNPDVADPDSLKVLLTIPKPYANHNGGMLVFGPDGYLYIGTGDGGSAGDPLNSGQSADALLGKILRIDVSGDSYSIPADNPFASGEKGKPEVWSMGWRNPWRFSFDRATGDKYIADVGQNLWEEVNVEKAGSPGGLNYGWKVMEGTHCFSPRTGCNTEGLVLPVAEYSHEQGISVTGGYVYRGAEFPRMQGYYFYADFGSSRVWALKETSLGKWETRELLRAGFPVSSFGEDEAGNVYVIDLQNGAIYKMIDKGAR